MLVATPSRHVPCCTTRSGRGATAGAASWAASSAARFVIADVPTQETARPAACCAAIKAETSLREPIAAGAPGSLAIARRMLGEKGSFSAGRSPAATSTSTSGMPRRRRIQRAARARGALATSELERTARGDPLRHAARAIAQSARAASGSHPTSVSRTKARPAPVVRRPQAQCDGDERAAALEATAFKESTEAAAAASTPAGLPLTDERRRARPLDTPAAGRLLGGAMTRPDAERRRPPCAAWPPSASRSGDWPDGDGTASAPAAAMRDCVRGGLTGISGAETVAPEVSKAAGVAVATARAEALPAAVLLASWWGGASKPAVPPESRVAEEATEAPQSAACSGAASTAADGSSSDGFDGCSVWLGLDACPALTRSVS